MKRMNFLATTVVVLLMLTPRLWALSYTMGDLTVLSQEASYEEFFKHALDIRPSERVALWREMVSKMAEGYARTLLGRSQIKPSEFKQIELLYRWPSLKGDDLFRARRQQIGLKYLESCLSSDNPCFADMRAFWEANPNDPEVGFKLAQFTQNLSDSPLSVTQLLDVPVKSPLSEFYCQKTFVLKELWRKIEIESGRLKAGANLSGPIRGLTHPDCLPHLNRLARQKLFSPDTGTDRELAYQVLSAQKLSTEALSDFFYTVYLLEKPSQGELFNYAWNRIIELKSSPLRRDRVLDMIKNLDPLPDEIFISTDETKKRVILTHFKLNFPEYLDLYSNQCLKFYSGLSSFPKGNPTIHCPDLMDSDLAGKLIDQTRIQRFKDVRKI